MRGRKYNERWRVVEEERWWMVERVLRVGCVGLKSWRKWHRDDCPAKAKHCRGGSGGGKFVTKGVTVAH